MKNGLLFIYQSLLKKTISHDTHQSQFDKRVDLTYGGLDLQTRAKMKHPGASMKIMKFPFKWGRIYTRFVLMCGSKLESGGKIMETVGPLWLFSETKIVLREMNDRQAPY